MTDRQIGFRGQQVLRVVTVAIEAGQRPPSYAMIAHTLGMNSTADVCHVVRRLERRGLIHRRDTGSRHQQGWHEPVILTPTT